MSNTNRIENPTEEFLVANIGKRGVALCRQYFYQSHGTQREGVIEASETFGAIFVSHEAYDSDSIFWIELEA